MEKLDLTPFFKTKAQARDFSVRLSIISEKVYENAFDLEDILSEQLGMQKKDFFMTLLRDNAVETEKASALKDFFVLLQNHIASLPVLTLSLAFEPKEKTLQVLTDWFLLNIKRQVILDISIDPSLIGGIAIHYQGKYLDYSIRKPFEKVVAESLTSTVVNHPPIQASAPQHHQHTAA